MSLTIVHYKLTGLYLFFQTDRKYLLKINNLHVPRKLVPFTIKFNELDSRPWYFYVIEIMSYLRGVDSPHDKKKLKIEEFHSNFIVNNKTIVLDNSLINN